MTDLVESLRRLYKDKKVSLDRVNELFKNKKISKTDYDYIVGK